MKVSVFGLGYVGCVSAACMAQDGHHVIGIDVNPTKVAQVAAGRSPIVEQGLDKLIGEQVDAKRLSVTLDAYTAVMGSEVSLICVGTPSKENGDLETRFVEQVCDEIGRLIAQKATYHTIVVRSTVLPGTVRNTLLPIVETASGKKAGEGFGLAMNPEFLREGSALTDYYDPGQIVIGAWDVRSGDTVAALYSSVKAPLIHTELESAEMIKYANNSFHALKIAFANEIGNLCKASGIDGRHVMEIVTQDTRLNISPAYLRPGFAFGGSCLPKDLRALTRHALQHDEPTPLLSAILPSNQMQIDRGICMIERTNKRRIGVLGLSFKENTDDLRESPVIPLVETLRGRGYEVCIYDETVCTDKLIGANRRYVEQKLPHIASMFRLSLGDVLDECDVLVITNHGASYRNVLDLVHPDQIVIDFAGLGGKSAENYTGICW